MISSFFKQSLAQCYALISTAIKSLVTGKPSDTFVPDDQRANTMGTQQQQQSGILSGIKPLQGIEDLRFLAARHGLLPRSASISTGDLDGRCRRVQSYGRALIVGRLRDHQREIVPIPL